MENYFIDFTIDGLEYCCAAELYEHGQFIEDKDPDGCLPDEVIIDEEPTFQNLTFYCYTTEEHVSPTTAMNDMAEQILRNLYWDRTL